MKPSFKDMKDLIRNPRPRHFIDRPVVQPATPVDQTPRALVYAWLESIGASNAEMDEVMEQCQHDKEARIYYLAKAKERIKL